MSSTLSVEMTGLPSLLDTTGARRAAPTRRSFLRGVARAGMVTGMAFLGLVTSGQPAQAARYFQEWTGTTTGPCDPVNGYARNHDEEGRKCGDSTVCTQLTCCYRSTGSIGNGEANAGNNLRGWHIYEPYKPEGYWRQRPNQCYSTSYDSWVWRTNGIRYGCSDGYGCGSSGCIKTICPWAR